MMRSRLSLLGLTLGGLLLLGAEARAVTVNYTATGTFGSGGGQNTTPNTNVLTIPLTGGTLTITYTNPGLQTVILGEMGLPFNSDVSFGTLDTEFSGTATGPVTFSPAIPFTLAITQITPVPSPPNGAAVFPATVTGTLQISNSQARLVFDLPLEAEFGGVTYRLIDQSIVIAPETTNNGETAIEGNVSVIPEPSAMVLVGMGAVAPLALVLRRRVKARAEA